jgi:hypothetical protein
LTFASLALELSSSATLLYGQALTKEDFPPSDQFTYKELLMVCEAFEDMLHSWNIHVDMPSDVPPPMRYDLTVNLLENECLPPRMGIFFFDFCTGVSEKCALKMYCRCRSIT